MKVVAKVEVGDRMLQSIMEGVPGITPEIAVQQVMEFVERVGFKPKGPNVDQVEAFFEEYAGTLDDDFGKDALGDRCAE